jgi:mannose-6-phosphate isomerase-like protein (cupin superfamily)
VQREDFVIRENIAFDGLERMDLTAMADSCHDGWMNQTLCRVNNSVIRLGVFHGEFPLHKHDDEDEFFFVLSGELLLDVRPSDGRMQETIVLEPAQGFVVPRGVIHRPRAPKRTIVLMVEKETVRPLGDP